jgi:hypothetical protein
MNDLTRSVRPTLEERRAQAVERLVRSRAALCSVLTPKRRSSAAGIEGMLPRIVGLFWRRARRKLADIPMASVAMDSVQNWWVHHPWRPTVETVAEALHGTVTMVVRSRPALSIGVAAGLGALLMTTRIWRWNPLVKRIRHFPSTAVNWLFREITHLPLQTLLAALFVRAGFQDSGSDPAATSTQHQSTVPPSV